MESGAQREEDLFQAAAQLSGSARLDFLDRECRGDADLRLHLDALLGAHEGTDSFMADSIDETPPAVNRFFGDELLEQIAPGAMGVVYRARHLAPKANGGPQDGPRWPIGHRHHGSAVQD